MTLQGAIQKPGGLSPSDRKGLKQNQWSGYPNFSLSTDLKSIVAYIPTQYINGGISIFDFPFSMPALPQEALDSGFVLYFGLYVVYNNGVCTYDIVHTVIDTNTLTPPIELAIYPIGTTVLYESRIINPTGGTLTTGIDGLEDGLQAFNVPRGGATLHSSNPPIIRYIGGGVFETTYNFGVGAIDGIGSNTSIDDGYVQGTIIPDGEDYSFPVVFFDNDIFFMSAQGAQYQNVIGVLTLINGSGADREWGVDDFSLLTIEIGNYEANFLGTYTNQTDFDNSKIVPIQGNTAIFGSSLVVFDGSAWQNISSQTSIPYQGYFKSSAEPSAGIYNDWQNLRDYLQIGSTSTAKRVYIDSGSPLTIAGSSYDNLSYRTQNWEFIRAQNGNNTGVVALSVDANQTNPMRFAIPSYLEWVDFTASGPNDQSGLRNYTTDSFTLTLRNARLTHNNGTAGSYLLSTDNVYRIDAYGDSILGQGVGPGSFAFFMLDTSAGTGGKLEVHLYDDAVLDSQLVPLPTIANDPLLNHFLEIHIHSPNVRVGRDNQYKNNFNCKIIYHTFINGDAIGAFTDGYDNIATINSSVVSVAWNNTDKIMVVELSSVAGYSYGDRVMVENISMTGGTASGGYLTVVDVDVPNDQLSIQFPVTAPDYGTYISGGDITLRDVRSLGYFPDANCMDFINFKLNYSINGGSDKHMYLHISDGLGNIAQIYESGAISGSHDYYVNGTIQQDAGGGRIRHTYVQIDTTTVVGKGFSGLFLPGKEILLAMEADTAAEMTVNTFTLGN